MYQLYYSPGACSMAVHVLLNELGQEVELIRARIHEEQPDSKLKAINPRGQVPVLIDEGRPLREGAAIILYLCEKHKSSLIPLGGWDHPRALQWLMFTNASLHNGYSRANFLKKKGAPDALIQSACDNIQDMWDVIEAELTDHGGDYICGDKITAADILITVIANWTFLPRQFTFGSKTKSLLRHVSERPAYKKALEAEQVEYKAAA